MRGVGPTGLGRQAVGRRRGRDPGGACRVHSVQPAPGRVRARHRRRAFHERRPGARRDAGRRRSGADVCRRQHAGGLCGAPRRPGHDGPPGARAAHRPALPGRGTRVRAAGERGARRSAAGAARRGDAGGRRGGVRRGAARPIRHDGRIPAGPHQGRRRRHERLLQRGRGLRAYSATPRLRERLCGDHPHGGERPVVARPHGAVGGPLCAAVSRPDDRAGCGHLVREPRRLAGAGRSGCRKPRARSSWPCRSRSWPACRVAPARAS